jgi:hypothetical protein
MWSHLWDALLNMNTLKSSSAVSTLYLSSFLLDVKSAQFTSWSLDDTSFVGSGVVRQSSSVGGSLHLNVKKISFS